MKIIPVLLLALATQACTAQDSHVVLAYRLYTSCVSGTLQVTHPVKDQAEFDDVLTYTENWCTMWTDAWYPAFVSENDAPELDFSEHIRFLAFRKQVKERLQEDYKKFLAESKKK